MGGRPTNAELKEKREAENRTILEKMEAMGQRLMTLESENEALKRKEPQGKKFSVGKGNVVESQWIQDVERKNLEAENEKNSLTLVKEHGFKEYTTLNGNKVSLVNSCPYCTSHKKDSLLDLMPKANRFSCRRCSKSWSIWNLGKPYTFDLERDYDGSIGKKAEGILQEA